MAIGRPEQSAITMIFLPLPRLEGPTAAPLFWPLEAAIDDGLREIELTVLLDIRRQGADDSL